jgi:uncharacterized protein (TIGR03083 family)
MVMPDTTTWINAVQHSHERFVDLVGPLSADEVEKQSYNSEWSIAQTASHLGSQAEIFELFLDAGLSGKSVPGGDVFGPIWDRWNALSPAQQVAESIRSNEAFVTRLTKTSSEERANFSLSMFGTDQDLAGLAALRLGEHAVHTWDIAVALDPAATVSADAVELLIDRLPQTAARSGKAVEDIGQFTVETTAPDRTFLLTVNPDVSLEPTDNAAADVLRLPAEAFLRLVYGRLDQDHTPAEVSDPRLPALRRVFPGF